MDEFAEQQIEQPETDAQWRLCEVLRDRLQLAQVQESYLPTSDDKFLAPVLHALEAHPGDNTTLAGWAARVFTTERTLARRCQQQLHMTFGEWRQRLRFLRAIVLLEQGKRAEHRP